MLCPSSHLPSVSMDSFSQTLLLGDFFLASSSLLSWWWSSPIFSWPSTMPVSGKPALSGGWTLFSQNPAVQKTGFFCFSLLAARAYLTLQFKPKTLLSLTIVVKWLGILHLASYLSISTLKLFSAFLLVLLMSIFFKKYRPRWGITAHHFPFSIRKNSTLPRL